MLWPGFGGYLGTAHRDGNRFVAPILYADDDWALTEDDSTIGFVFEDRADRPISLLRDARHGRIQGLRGTERRFYVLGDGLGGSVSIARGKPIKAPTLLRFVPGADALDPNYALDLGALLNTPGLQGLWPVTKTKFVVQAWASEIPPSSVLKSPDDYWSSPYFDWKLVDIETREVRDVQGIARSVPYSTVRFALDGRAFLQRYIETLADTGTAELFELSEDGRATQVATTGGEFWFVGRVNNE